jgi:hypothetical protein
MSVKRLGVSNPTLNTNTQVLISDNSYLASVIITNKDTVDGFARVWLVPSGSSSSSQYSYIVYDVRIPSGNSIETHRFGINTSDSIYVRSSSSSMSFTLSGIYEPSASLEEHILETTNVHGIPDTSILATTNTTNSLNTRLISIELGLGIFD